jgi:hypothetical protein
MQRGTILIYKHKLCCKVTREVEAPHFRIRKNKYEEDDYEGF